MQVENIRRITPDNLEQNSKNPMVTQAELKERWNISIVSVKRAMKELQTRGEIERIGSSRKGYWKIVK